MSLKRKNIKDPNKKVEEQMIGKNKNIKIYKC